jgi:hypothetical protein
MRHLITAYFILIKIETCFILINGLLYFYLLRFNILHLLFFNFIKSGINCLYKFKLNLLDKIIKILYINHNLDKKIVCEPELLKMIKKILIFLYIYI